MFYLFVYCLHGQGFIKSYDLFDSGIWLGGSVVSDELGVNIFGKNGNQTGGPDSIWFVRISYEGDLLISKGFDFPDTSGFLANDSFLRLEDGYIGVGSFTNSSNNNLEVPTIAKFNLEGDLVWQNSYPNIIDEQFSERLLQVTVDHDGGLIAIGQSSPPLGGFSGIIIKTDIDGNEVWRNYFNYQNFVVGYFIVDLLEDGYLAQGTMFPNADNQIGLISILDAFGNEINGFSLMDSDDNSTITQQINADSPSLYKGFFSVNADENVDQLEYYYGAFDESFNIIESTLITEIDNFSFAIYEQELIDNGVVFMGNTIVSGLPSFRESFITKVNNNGVKEWHHVYVFNENGINECYGLDNTPDGGFVACGATLYLPGDQPESQLGEQDLWVFKTDEFGCVIPGCHLSVEELGQDAKLLQVHPNPSNGMVSVRYAGQSSSNLQSLVCTNALGKVVKTVNHFDSIKTYMLDMSDFSNGIYQLTLLAKGRAVETEKIVLVK